MAQPKELSTKTGLAEEFIVDYMTSSSELANKSYRSGVFRTIYGAVELGVTGVPPAVLFSSKILEAGRDLPLDQIGHWTPEIAVAASLVFGIYFLRRAVFDLGDGLQQFKLGGNLMNEASQIRLELVNRRLNELPAPNATQSQTES